MKKNIFFSLLAAVLILFFSNSGSAQSQTWKQFIIDAVWQQQNPSPPALSRMISFNEYGTMTFSASNLATRQKFPSQRWDYSISQSTLTISTGEGDISYKLVFISQDKIALIDRNGEESIFARSGSLEDRFMANLLQMQNYGNMDNSFYSPYQSSSPQSQTCYTCLGTGRCRVCGGSGIYSLYGNSSTCKACSGTGKCWHCQGSGKQ